MSYVKWNSSKIHIVNAFAGRNIWIGNGKVSANPNADCAGDPPLTSCGRAVPAENEWFEQLPEAVDRSNDLCNSCFVGVGVSKAPGPNTNQASSNGGLNKITEKLKDSMAAAARDLFT